MIVPLMVLTDEEAWLVSAIRDAADESISWRVLDCALQALPDDGMLVIAAESARHHRLSPLMSAAMARLGPDRCLLVIWNEEHQPDLRPLLGHLPEEVLYLPREASHVIAWLRRTLEAPPLADLTQYLRPGLPYAFDHALRHVLARSGDPLGDPPPGSVAALARKLALNRSNLQRRAPQFRVDLGGLIGGTRARWALARMRRPEDVPEAMRAMGIKDPRTLGNLLHANAGCSLHGLSVGRNAPWQSERVQVTRWPMC